MKSMMNVNTKHQPLCIYKTLILVLISGAFGAYLFFLNPWMRADLHSNSYSWFLEFSQTIFQPQSAYYAESILLPLLAKLLGISRSLYGYKLLCGLFVISILPITAIFAQRYFQSFYKAFLFITLFGISFQFLQYYILGFPDPLTILLLVSAVFQKRLGAIFTLLVLAMLSHFSMAALGTIGLIGLVYFSPNVGFYSQKKFVGVAIAAILAGKAILLAWYEIFHYQLLSRLDWALGKGYLFFLDRYETDIIGFWLTPGVPFLALYFLIVVYFLLSRHFLFVAAAMFAIALAYAALFWTVDGLRVFAVVISASYGCLLISFIQGIAKRLNSKIC